MYSAAGLISVQPRQVVRARATHTSRSILYLTLNSLVPANPLKPGLKYGRGPLVKHLSLLVVSDSQYHSFSNLAARPRTFPKGDELQDTDSLLRVL